MAKIWNFIRNNFLTKKFLIFGIIGLLNTLIHWAVYTPIRDEAVDSFFAGAFFANSVAFVVASVFSYFANAYFTFKPENKNATQFSVVFLTFLSRWLISSLLTWLFDYIILNWIGLDYAVYPITEYIAPFMASAILIPVAYFVLDFIFKKTDIKKAV